MLRNRALQAKQPASDQASALEAWRADGVNLRAVDLSQSGPLSQALPNALEISISAGQTGRLVNTGYWGNVFELPHLSFEVTSGDWRTWSTSGMKVDRNWVYTASFYAKLASAGSSACGPQLAIQLFSDSQQGTIFAEQPIPSPCLNQNWQKFEVQIQPGQSAQDARNALGIKFTSTSNSNEVVHITLASLFPPTYKNRPNGVRIDLAEVSGIHGQSQIPYTNRFDTCTLSRSNHTLSKFVSSRLLLHFAEPFSDGEGQ